MRSLTREVYHPSETPTSDCPLVRESDSGIVPLREALQNGRGEPGRDSPTPQSRRVERSPLGAIGGPPPRDTRGARGRGCTRPPPASSRRAGSRRASAARRRPGRAAPPVPAGRRDRRHFPRRRTRRAGPPWRQGRPPQSPPPRRPAEEARTCRAHPSSGRGGRCLRLPECNAAGLGPHLHRGDSLVRAEVKHVDGTRVVAPPLRRDECIAAVR